MIRKFETAADLCPQGNADFLLIYLNISWHPENYKEIIELNNMARALTNTALVTILVVVGQLLTSVIGGYAFARLKFPGRDTVFVFYLGTIMIPFVMLIVPLYQLMVLMGWTDHLAALIIRFAHLPA